MNLLKVLVRRIVILWIGFLLCFLAVDSISPYLPDHVGVLAFDGIMGSTISHTYVDFDTGVTIHTWDAHPSERPRATLPILQANGERTALILSADGGETIERTIGIYDDLPTETPPNVRWLRYEQHIMLSWFERDSMQSFIAIVDVQTGSHNDYVIDNFLVGAVSVSPNKAYLLLRATSTQSIRTEFVPVEMLLMNTHDGSYISLEDEIGQRPVYAYWSPDSQYLAIGYEITDSLRVSVGIYTLVSNETITLDVTVAQGDVAYFTEARFVSTLAVLWSPDSDAIVVYSEQDDTLYHVLLDGTQQAYIGGRYLPEAWSPDGQYVLLSGYDDRGVGAFVVDLHTETLVMLASDTRLMPDQTSLRWSGNSRYIATLTSSGGIRQQHFLNVFNTAGELVTQTQLFDVNTDNPQYIMRPTLRWLD
ncbi:MAG: hypothetical protein AAFR81_15660 [Chloroflexota bacterium]